MMEYNNLVEQAKKEIPEFNAEYNKMLKEDIIDKDSGVHIVFSYVFVPVAKRAVTSGNKELTDKVFGFIEKMAESDDKLVSEVCDFTIMEELHDEFSKEELLPLLGNKSKLSLSAVSGYMPD